MIAILAANRIHFPVRSEGHNLKRGGSAFYMNDKMMLVSEPLERLDWFDKAVIPKSVCDISGFRVEYTHFWI